MANLNPGDIVLVQYNPYYYNNWFINRIIKCNDSNNYAINCLESYHGIKDTSILGPGVMTLSKNSKVYPLPKNYKVGTLLDYYPELFI